VSTLSATPASASRSTPPILGPQDRESFFAVQARDRRASWKLAAASILGVLLMASALVLTLAPPLVAVVIVIADVLNLFVPGTLDVFDMLMGSASTSEAPLVALLGPALIVVPGTILAFASWMIVSRLTRRSEVTGLLLRQVAREPHAGDLEEHQLGNIVAEMAIAAGIQPPKLRLVDAPPMNAVALGSSVDGATIVVTRGLLDALDRGETQAIIGHLIASIGNGDLRIAHYILTMYATVGLLERLPFTPIDPAMRARVRKVVRSARAGDATSDEDIGALALELYRSPGEDDGGSIETSDPFDLMKRPPKIGWVERLPKLPGQGIAMALFYVTMAQSMCRLTLLGLFVNPLLALLWRRRRVLADASAVQLCRDPTSLVRAVAKLSNQATPPPGDPFLAFLFPASPLRGGLEAAGNFGGPKAIFPAPSLPNPNARAARLHRMGAQGLAAARHRMGPIYVLQLVGRGILALLAVALWAFCFTMGCLVLAISICVGAPMAFFLLLLGPHILLRGIIPWLLGR
jgi:Zn-dependent protease with chaperone function